MTSPGPVTLLTGFPSSFLGTRLLHELLRADRAARVVCLVQTKFLPRARQLLEARPREERARVELLEGDAAAIDFGLSGAEYRDLAARVEVIHHAAAVTYLGVDPRLAEQVNVGGAGEAVELAESASALRQLVLWSSALVSGKRRGYVLEDELSAPGGFRNAIEETRFRAERIVRAAQPRVPVTILRPSILVGDSRTGEIDRLEGPYLLVLLMLSAPVDLRVPMPGQGEVPLNLVPIDFVVSAGTAIARDPRSIGRAFHLVDPHPLSAKRAFELIARAAGKPLPRGVLPTNLATALLRAPGLERFAKSPRAFLEQLATEVVYDARNTDELLGGRDLSCPGFETYVDVLVDYVRRQQAERKDAARVEADQTADPLD